MFGETKTQEKLLMQHSCTIKCAAGSARYAGCCTTCSCRRDDNNIMSAGYAQKILQTLKFDIVVGTSEATFGKQDKTSSAS